MKILLVSTQDYIHHPVPSRHHYIFEELATRHEVHVPHFHVSDGPERSTRLHVHEATLFPFKNPAFHYTANAPYHAAVMSRIIREHEIDVVVAGHLLAGTAAIRAAQKRGIPVVFDLKDWLPDSAAAYYHNRLLKDTIYKVVWAITRYNLDHSTAITTVSPSLVDRLREHGYSSQLITNGVNTDYFKPMDGSMKRKALGIPEDAFVVGFSGSIERFFDLEWVIKSFKKVLAFHENSMLLIVGGSLFTSYDQELKDLVEHLGLKDRVIFTGTVPYPEMPEYVACMDVCLIPFSSATWDNIALPNKFFEYSACGKPILSTPVPDVMKIAQENYRVYRSEEEYLEQIKDLIEMPRQYDLDLSGYSWKVKAQEFEDLFTRLLQDS
ncbi:glycosyltransferase involved in cell wall biosynthesis [Methanofollis sp. W23]|uniref:glycosyltransferase family 4 protein n=1 Tax=Methanofollis sp. W23 TaxID=2817849 RepID=UPI001AEB389E|nr:glycosyltransferase family 4 protein [Methanofollis sp. W23]MBP2146857.1 glycosyltransferase involved in cell wall biosynthesis [Methanofollis sp. W23]